MRKKKTMRKTRKIRKRNTWTKQEKVIRRGEKEYIDEGDDEEDDK